jgi:sugar/nucleoside kinase (ribokinase family)
MTVLVVGSVALDSVETPFGKADNVLGGSGTFFSASASHMSPVQLVGVIGNDYPLDDFKKAFASRPVDISGLEQAEGASFRWRGRYRHDLNSAETLETHLGVFSNFTPKIPEKFRKAPFVFLGNIDPRLQLQVLTQVEKPKLVACDTMNFWIESRRPDLLKLLEHVDLITLNDAEARQLTEQFNLVKAAKWIMEKGPKLVIIKKGEHGAFMFTPSTVFFAPAYPLEAVFDPTGAGDSFAGGFMGYLARSGDLSDASLRRAVVHGSAMGSFAVEKFSIERLIEITPADIKKRVAEFYTLTSFQQSTE